MIIANYENAELNGTSHEYYPNGKIRNEISWVKGEKHGKEMHYDEQGKLLYVLNYFHDLQAGPQVIYPDDFDSVYNFLTFENTELLNVGYRNDSVVSQKGNILNYFSSSGLENDQPVRDIFLYNIQPPGAQVYYDFVKKNRQDNKVEVVKTIGPMDNFFYKFRYYDRDSIFIYGVNYRIK